jgi:hypothetical protein
VDPYCFVSLTVGICRYNVTADTSNSPLTLQTRTAGFQFLNFSFTFYMFGICGGKAWIGCIWLSSGTSGGPFEHGNEPEGSINDGEFLD